MVDELLAPCGLDPRRRRRLGGPSGRPRIIDVTTEQLGLTDGDLAESWAVLNDHGNCSSATVLLVLDRIRRERALSYGDPVLFMPFGPGPTLYAALLQVRSGPRG